MSIKASFSVTRAWSEAFGGLMRAWGGAWLILAALWAALAFVPHLAMQPFGQDRLVRLAVLVVVGLAKVMALGALYRVALFGAKARDEGLGFGGVQIGRPELRLLMAGIVIGLFFMLIAAALLVVFAIATNVAGIDPGTLHIMPGGGIVDFSQTGVWLIAGYGLASLLLLAFLGVKFTLAQAASVAEHRLVSLNALGLSSGNVGKLFIGLFVILAPMLIAAGASFQHLHRAFVLSPKPPALDMGHHLHLIVHAALVALAVFIVMPLCTGFLSSAYRQIVVRRKA